MTPTAMHNQNNPAPSFSAWYKSQIQKAQREETRRWGCSLLAVVSVSGVVLWGATHLTPPPLPAPEAPAAIAIDMAPAPVSPPAPPTNVPLGPQQTLSVPDTTPVDPPKITVPPSPAPTPPVPVPKPEKPRKLTKLHKTTVTLNKPVPDKTPPANTTTAPPATEAPPAQTQAAPSASASSSQSSSQAPATWQSALLAQLEKFKRYPTEAMADHQEGVPTVTFAMNRQGHVLWVKLAHSSGHTLLDTEALALPKRAQPLPVPPESVTGDPLTLTVPVEFYIHQN